MQNMSCGRRRVALGIAAWCCCATLHAQAPPLTYPAKPIRLVVPFPPGGTTDAIGRLIGQKLHESWAQPVVVENRAGAGGIIGNDLVAKAPPDGYTILLGITTLIQAPAMKATLPYDVFKDFVPVAQIASSFNLFVVQSSIPATTLKEFVAHARANPRKYNFGSSGTAGSAHVHGEMLNAQAGLDLVHVPYKGAAAQVNDLLNGELSTAFVDIAAAQSHLKSGKFRVLAITGARRAASLPDVPTFTELGYKSYEPYGWFGVFVPAGTPPEIVAKLSTQLVRIAKLPEVASRIEGLGLQVDGFGATEFSRVLRVEARLWGQAIEQARIKVD